MEDNYTIKYENNVKEKTINDIYNLKWNHIKKQKKIGLKIDFNLIKEKDYKKIVKNFQKLKYKLVKKGFDVSNLVIYVLGFDSENSKHTEFMNAIQAIMKPSEKEMYSYIYDIVCDFLDHYFVNKNLCDFKDDRCGEKRNTNCTCGCCRHFKNKKIGPILPNGKLVVCEYLKDKRCSAKCIGCKLFTCGYLRKKGVTFKLKNIFLIDTFFNPIQKYFIKYKLFTPKEEIIRLLLLWS